MTPTELYEWAKVRKLEDAEIKIVGDDLDGCAFPIVKCLSQGSYEVVIDVDWAEYNN